MIVVVILSILAAVVVPHFSNAGRVSRENVMREDLRFMRSQISVYRAQHHAAPGYPGGDNNQAPTEAAFLEQMSRPTNAHGVVGPLNSADYPLGPYIGKIPPNPVNALDTIRMVAPGAFPTEPAGTHGWVYQPSTLKFHSDAVGEDQQGVYYFDY